MKGLREMLGYEPEAFLVTDSKANRENINDIAVFSFEAIQVNKTTWIIISVGRKLEDEIKAYLQSRKYNRYLCVRDLPEDITKTE